MVDPEDLSQPRSFARWILIRLGLAGLFILAASFLPDRWFWVLFCPLLAWMIVVVLVLWWQGRAFRMRPCAICGRKDVDRLPVARGPIPTKWRWNLLPPALPHFEWVCMQDGPTWVRMVRAVEQDAPGA
jgi:hypothetical protein